MKEAKRQRKIERGGRENNEKKKKKRKENRDAHDDHLHMTHHLIKTLTKKNYKSLKKICIHFSLSIIFFLLNLPIFSFSFYLNRTKLHFKANPKINTKNWFQNVLRHYQIQRSKLYFLELKSNYMKKGETPVVVIGSDLRYKDKTSFSSSFLLTPKSFS